MTNKILFIAYHFPPDAAVGALRTQKFVKYLPQYGWQPFVLTVEDRHYSVHDPNRLIDIKQAIIQRTTFWRSPLQIYLNLRDKYIKKNISHSNEANNNYKTHRFHCKSKLLYIKQIFTHLNHLPDDKLYWSIPGFFEGIKLLKKNNIEKTIVSVPPHSSLILAYLLSVFSGSKLVVDFRDPWTLAYQSFSSISFLNKFENLIEKKVLNRSSGIITTNKYFQKALSTQYPNFSKKIYVIPNGYDSSDFPEINNNHRHNKYIISYLGTFYLQRNPENFLMALSLFLSDKEWINPAIEVRFIGFVHNAQGLSVKTMIQEYKLDNIVKIMGFVPHSETLKLMIESDLLLLFAPNQPYQIPAKTYEYIATQKPILALTENGATSSLIYEVQCGICVNPNDVEGIRIALHTLYENHLNNKQYFNYNCLLYERRKEAENLANLINIL